MYKIQFKILKLINITLLILITLTTLFSINTFIEDGVVSSKIDNFKSRGNYCETVIISNQTVNIYKIKPFFDYELNTFQKVFDLESLYVGSCLDITITSRNPFRHLKSFILKDLGNFISSKTYIGHASINIGNNLIIESVGNTVNSNYVRVIEDSWIIDELKTSSIPIEIINLRFKELENKEEIISTLLSYENTPYSFLNINGVNCTSLITKTFKQYNINLNYDFFFTTGSDLLISSYLYINFVFERLIDNTYNIYYLDILEEL